MEKTISAHLFAALVSTKEQRFVFMAGTPEQQKFDDAATKIESAIEDPANLTPEILQKITDLKISAIADKDNSKRMNELEDIVNKKTELSREIGETEKKTADTNPDWKKIATDIESTDAAKKTVAIEAAQKILVESRDQIHDLSGTIMNLEALDARLLAKVTVKVIAAHNQNIERVQALDKANVIPFVSGEKIGGKDATDELAKIETRGNDFISKDLNDALKATKEAEGPAAK